MKFVYVLGLILFIMGFTVNFLPTLIYFATVYPNLKDSFSERGAYLKYRVSLFPVLIELNETNRMLLEIGSTMVFRLLNESCLEYDMDMTVNKIIKNEEKEKSLRFSNMTLCRGNPVYNFFFIDPGVNTVNITGKLYELHRPPFNYVGVATRQFLLYARDYVLYSDTGDIFYIELADGRKILLDDYMVQGKQNPLVELLIQLARRGDEEIARVVEKGNITSVGDPGVALRDGNVKPSLDIGKRLLLDFTYTFFPVNMVLIMISMILIILARRRVVR